MRYFQRIKWQYLVLDEAQAIKSSSRLDFDLFLRLNNVLTLFHARWFHFIPGISCPIFLYSGISHLSNLYVIVFCSFPLSVRWKILLGFNCRNRLLLTGTPIQNTMAEVGFISVFLYHDRLDGNVGCILWVPISSLNGNTRFSGRLRLDF